jgi:hypothetical protein
MSGALIEIEAIAMAGTHILVCPGRMQPQGTCASISLSTHAINMARIVIP